MSAYLWHITLDTGDRRRSPRWEVAADAVDLVWPRLLACIEGDELAMLPPPYRLKVTTAGAFLLATIQTPDLRSILTFGVAPRARGAGRLWSELHKGRDGLATLVHEPPDAPWCAVRFEVMLPDDVEMLIWAGDMERLVAWAWIERRHLLDPSNG